MSNFNQGNPNQNPKNPGHNQPGQNQPGHGSQDQRHGGFKQPGRTDDTRRSSMEDKTRNPGRTDKDKR